MPTTLQSGRLPLLPSKAWTAQFGLPRAWHTLKPALDVARVTFGTTIGLMNHLHWLPGLRAAHIAYVIQGQRDGGSYACIKPAILHYFELYFETFRCSPAKICS
jgi:hypothetical protein